MGCLRRHLLPIFPYSLWFHLLLQVILQGEGKHLCGEPSTSTEPHNVHAEGMRYIHGCWVSKAGTVSQPEVGSARRVLKHRQVVLLDVAEQDLCPPVNGLEQGSQPLGTPLALPELPVQAQGLQQQALQSARPQRGHCCCWEAAVEEQKRQGEKGLSKESSAEKEGAAGHWSKDASRGNSRLPRGTQDKEPSA